MQKRPIRVACISGSPADRRWALADVAGGKDEVDVLVGDWMSELNMPRRAWEKHNDGIGYESTFLEALEPALESIVQRKLKLVANAGATATKDLYDIVVRMIKERGLDLTVAWIEGDEVTDLVNKSLEEKSNEFINICTGTPLADWGHSPFYAQCYLGGMGIASALEGGADIVICGRVADASPVIGTAAWWHGWRRDDLDQLAQALIAGHLIECTTYVTGGNFTGFKSLDWSKIVNMGFPIAEIAADGDVIITKQTDTGGLVSVETCKEQLLYEIQGPWYFNCDVTADISGVTFEQVGKDRVRLAGVKGLAPPPTTKVGMTAFGGYMAEVHYCLVGLDIEQKAKMLELQIRHSFGDERLKKLTRFEFSVMGSVPSNPRCQNAATVDFRLVAQAKNRESLEAKNFLRPAVDIIMQTYPASTYQHDIRTAVPDLYFEYWVSLLPQSLLNQQVHFSSGNTTNVAAPSVTKIYPRQQPTTEAPSEANAKSFGETEMAPLGYIVHGRAGDKGSNCNMGFFVRHEDEWEWLRSFLTTERLIELLDQEYRGQKIDRFELPSLWAVHFLLHDHLDRGCSANVTYDILGKFGMEYIRCKTVALPTKFLARGRI